MSIIKSFSLILFSLTFCCCQSIKTKNKPFAVAKEGSVVINIDTTAYKKFLEDNLFADRKVVLNTIQIKEQKTLSSGETFYYVYLATKDKKIKVARWLNKKGDNFYVNDEIEEGPLFEQSYLICEGGGDCGPEVYIDKENRLWGCSKIIACYVEGVKMECSSAKTYIEPYEE
ncbi:hypothetical protein [Flavobacterium sp. NRK1]|uniref:hypothetical protein n=1 Tax=Flavobacterium sp. NRK1 TaxID=2954929 RepID=UPI0020935427|nr:hypothetical protein [Flavobacterium sp. NRK1]MCO6147547.1 hypothetical protein [Flavobacterium sp. NRK1]